MTSVTDDWINMEQWLMILTGENWSAGRKTLYSVGGRWMDEYGAMVEWYWQWKQVLGGKPVLAPLCPPQTPHGQLLFGSTAKYITASNANTVCVLRKDFQIALDTSLKSHYSCVPPVYQNLGGYLQISVCHHGNNNKKKATIYLVISFETQQSFTVEIKLRPTAANI